MNENYKYSEITEQIISAYYQVFIQLEYGFLEKVYERAMTIELSKHGLACEKQKNIKVFMTILKSEIILLILLSRIV